MATKPIEDLTTEEQTTFRSEIGAVGTAAEITAALQGAEANPVRIGEEYMPERLPVESLVLGDTSGDVLPDGSWGGTGVNGEIAVHNNSDTGGIVYRLDRNNLTGLVVATSAEIQAGLVIKEIGRFRLEPSEIAAKIGSWYLLTGTLILQSDAAITSTPAVGVHIDGTTTAVQQNIGVYRAGLGVADVYSNRFELYVPIKLTEYVSDTTKYRLDADSSKSPTHAWRISYTAGALNLHEPVVFADSTSAGSNVLKALPAEIILSLRVPQDAVYAGTVSLLADNVRLTPLA